MIKIQRFPRPEQLTDELVNQLTAVYNSTKNDVWNQDFIKRDLLLMSSDKCCYCECKLGEESKYMEVEHFKPKNLYPLLVMQWENLLPSCKRCNIAKADHDTEIEPIIHPVNDDPRDHLKFRSYRFYPKTVLGKKAIDIIDLNNRRKLVDVRFKLGSEVKDALDKLEKDALELPTNKYERRLHRILDSLKGLMAKGRPTEEYCATIASEIIHEDSFQFLKKFLCDRGCWDDECKELESSLLRVCFEV